MKIHEYQAKSIFDAYSIPTPKGEVAIDSEQVKKTAQNFNKPVVIKAQVHVGGRGKAGGVKLAKSPEEAQKHADNILGMNIKDLTVKKVFTVEAVNIKKEYYLGLILDRANECITIMSSEAGGMDIEELAATQPEKINKVSINPLIGFKRYHGLDLFSSFLKDKNQLNSAIDITEKLYRIFLDKDCSLVEINPLAEIDTGEILACDAKINFDENAIFKHKDIEELKDPDTIDKFEEEAKELGLSFIPLDGNVGCVVNGAGLAMATMDVVKLYNGEPANFLDVGGSSNPQKVVKAFEILTSNPKVEAILFNIFGGITRCDDIAKGILTALEQIDVKLPIVIRLTGTNEEEARKMLASRNDLILAKEMNEAVELVVKQLKK